MSAEAQKGALAASRKAASSVFTDIGDDEASLIAVKAAPVPGDVRRVEYNGKGLKLAFLLEAGIEVVL